MQQLGDLGADERGADERIGEAVHDDLALARDNRRAAGFAPEIDTRSYSSASMSIPFSRAADSVMPTEATCGSVNTTARHHVAVGDVAGARVDEDGDAPLLELVGDVARRQMARDGREALVQAR